MASNYMSEALPCAMVETRYLGPTNTKPSRVVAKHVSVGTRVVVSWDHALDVADNHAAAARACIEKGAAEARKLGLEADPKRDYGRPWCASVEGGGYLFAFPVGGGEV